MNFLILINSAPQYKYFYFEVGAALERAGHKIYYAVDSKRSCILEPLAELDGSASAFFFDEFFKKHYEANLASMYNDVTWGECFFSEFDRFLTHDFNLDKPEEYWQKAKSCLESFFEDLIKDLDITAVVYENISNSFAFFAYKAAQNNNKKYLGLIASRLSGRFEIQTSILDGEVERIQRLAALEPTDDELKWYDAYRNNIMNISPDYMLYNNLDNISMMKLFSLKKVIHVVRLLKSYWRVDHFYDYQFGNPIRAITKGLQVNLTRKISAIRSLKYFDADRTIELSSQREIFYVYPIHFHPESSTSVLSPLYTNEFNNILNISNCLPFGVKLYVKDHMSAYGCQPAEFYRKVSALPGVRLVKPSHNIKKLIIKSQGLITVNSTAGFEALILGRPVYLLGRVFYQDFPGVVKLNNFSEIPSGLEMLDVDAKMVAAHIVAYYRYTYEGDLRIGSWKTKERKYYERLACLLEERAC
ncbi:capsular polysaccharide export protein, LipB/KpsS family [Pseudomonas beijingensis]|uniref:capsular polysaccharide export protein, LipB/KpsS family n=1 Tax=Pseudomonas beijingensis TaxID=2954101 RepID=UPI00273506D3|nr:hypothetical protein [Pseudomonas sp. FP2262]WLH47915.1 hypothetical protein PSH83_08350 [Pseudomonas sp. FP2262]